MGSSSERDSDDVMVLGRIILCWVGDDGEVKAMDGCRREAAMIRKDRYIVIRMS